MSVLVYLRQEFVRGGALKVFEWRDAPPGEDTEIKVFFTEEEMARTALQQIGLAETKLLKTKAASGVDPLIGKQFLI